MNKEPYHFEEEAIYPDGTIPYTFVSVGNKGNITKIVAFQPIDSVFYNLALADYDASTQIIDDEVVTNNGDMSKVLSTTWAIMLLFLGNNPDKCVVIQGNSETKQKLYARLIFNNLITLKQHYEVLGVNESGNMEAFSTQKNYIGFIIKRILI